MLPKRKPGECIIESGMIKGVTMPRKQQVPKKEEPKQETKPQIISVVKKTPPPVESNPGEIISPAEEKKMATSPQTAKKQSQKASPVVLAPPPSRDVTPPVETTLLKDQEVGEPDVESLPDEKTQYKKKEKFYIFKRPYKFTLKGDINLIEWECDCGYENEVSVLVGSENISVFCPQCGKLNRFRGTLLGQKGATVGDEAIPDVSP